VEINVLLAGRDCAGRRVGPWRGNSYNATGLFTWGALFVAGKIEGAVVAFGPTGNLVTDIPHDRLKGVPAGDGVKIICDEHETVGIYAADHQEQPSTLMAILGESGFLELTIVGDSAKMMLGVGLREKVVVKW
jgi:S-adenosylmethionine hydrolase